MKKIVTLFLALVLCLGLLGSAAAAEEAGSYPEVDVSQSGSLDNFKKTNTYVQGQFSDVSAGNWYEKSVAAVYEYGLMLGVSKNRFDGGGTLTLAQVIAIADRLHNIYYGGSGIFTQGTPWYQVYETYALRYHLILDGSFSDLSAPATRAQMASIISAAFPEKALPAINTVTFIPDIPESASYRQVVLRLYNAGILQGSDSDGTFRPNSTITRAEMAAIASRLADPSLREHFSLDYAAGEYKTLYAAFLRTVPSPSSKRFALIYMDNNDVPELAVSSMGDNWYYCGWDLYTIVNHTVQKIGFFGERGADTVADLALPYGKKTGLVQSHSGSVDKTSEAYYFEIVQSTNCETIATLEQWTSDPFSGSAKHYLVNGREVTKAVYDQELKKQQSACTSVLTTSNAYKLTEQNIETILT